MEIITRKEAKEQGLKYYFTGKPCKYGHIADRLASRGDCCECVRKRYEQNKEIIAERARKYREQNKERVAETARRYYEKNKEKTANRRRKYSREYYEQNKEKIAEKNRKRYEQNRDKALDSARKYREQNREKIAERMRKHHRANPELQFIRNSLNRCMDNFAGKRAKAEELLGYTSEHLKQHIESQFEEGMSWENHSLTGWHIDHIKPVSVFIKEGITDPAIINALDNLQPLWSRENFSKGAKHER